MINKKRKKKYNLNYDGFDNTMLMYHPDAEKDLKSIEEIIFFDDENEVKLTYPYVKNNIPHLEPMLIDFLEGQMLKESRNNQLKIIKGIKDWVNGKDNYLVMMSFPIDIYQNIIQGSYESHTNSIDDSR